MAKNGAKTGKRPTSNQNGIQGSGLAKTNPKGMNAKGPASIMAQGKGPGKTKDK